MKKFISFVVLSGMLVCAAQANEPAPRKNSDRRKENFRRPGISLPVYASAPRQVDGVKAAPTPEQRAKFNAARKRRFEIMVLIGAYKIMPENERQALKAELLKRIEADFQAAMADQRERIARAEADLKKLRSEFAEREANGKVLVERELDRLLKMQYPRNRPKPKKKP